MRKNIFEILESKYDILSEYTVIDQLFHSTLLFHYSFQTGGETITIEDAINKTCFYSWKQRGSCISVSDMLKKLDFKGLKVFSPNGRICQLEYFCNLINLANTKLNYPEFQKTPQMIMLEQNIDILLNHLNYEKHVFEEQEKVILIPKNPAATAVAEISSENTAMAILMYHHASLRGQLEEKRKLLLSIAQEYEPLLKKGIDGFSSYFDNARNMLNNVHLRHNNKEGKDKIEKIAKMSDEELENWYDELYQLLLFCVLIKDNKERKDKMTEFLKGLKGQK